MKKLTSTQILFLIGVCFFIISILMFGCGPEIVQEQIMRSLPGEDSLSKRHEILGQKGDAFGGSMGPLMAWLGAIVTFLAFWVQYKANVAQNIQNNKQAEDIAIERFESRFFKFIDYHRENVENMRHKVSNSSSDDYSTGSIYFVVVMRDLKKLLKKYADNPTLATDNMSKKLTINYIYYCLFYGAWPDKRAIIESKFNKSNDDFIEIGFDKIAEYSKYAAKKSLFHKNVINRNPYPYYSGHVNRLGSYFRNWYQAIKYVDSANFLGANKKYEYVKHFRAQLSAYEQLLMFYNSLSDLGIAWEMEHYSKKTSDLSIDEKKKLYNKLLITKYDLIRNTPYIDKDNIIFDHGNMRICISDFYVLHCSEHEKEWSISGILPFKDNTESICRFCFNKDYIDFQNEDVRPEIRQYIDDGIFDDEAVNNNVAEFSCTGNDCTNKSLIEELKAKLPKKEIVTEPA